MIVMACGLLYEEQFSNSFKRNSSSHQQKLGAALFPETDETSYGLFQASYAQQIGRV